MLILRLDSYNRCFTHTNSKYLCSINTTRKRAVLSLMVKLERKEKSLKPRRKWRANQPRGRERKERPRKLNNKYCANIV